jgi:hypothetical protein
MDLAHKTASPKTYPCKLCMVTYSGATINKLWKRYVANLGIPAIFMHRNEFAQAFPSQEITFPSILIEENKSLKILVSSDDFKNINNVSDLMNTLNNSLKK